MFDADDAWERKTRPQFQESDLSRRLMQVAGDSNATATALNAVADEALAHLNAQWSHRDGCVLVLEALAAHPNTPPARFNDLFLRTPVARRAFCRNPVAPFLLLETPDFLASLHEYAQRELLYEADLPPAFVRLLANDHGASRANDIQETARMHVAVAGEAQSRAEWETEARDFYRKIVHEATDWEARDWHAELVEIGVLPAWVDGGTPFGPPNTVSAIGPDTSTERLITALKYDTPNVRRLARRHPNAPPDAREISRRAFADRWSNGIHGYAEKYNTREEIRHQSLVTLASALLGNPERHYFSNKVASLFWTERFEAVWVAPLTDDALPLCPAPFAPTGRDLLEHLTRDANRLVRAAAKTRLADPDYRFTL